jgi:acyl-CoA synthetase (AMP-forming)/AMP-acid ligase II
MLMPSPVTHVTGYSSGINLCFMSEMQTALMERWDADHAIDIINSIGVTLTLGATPFLQELLAAAKRRGDRLPGLRQFSCGGAAVPPTLVREAQDWFENCVVARVYGSTEVPLVSYGWRDNPELAATSDGQLYAFDVRVLDDNGRDVAPGADGEIAARGPGMFLGYADREQTLEAHTGDGYFLTGDIGHVTEEGAVVITDRKKDLIIRGGENLSAKEIENVLHRHPGVKEAAVVSMPHERLGEGVCAFVIAVGSEPPSGDELSAFAESQSLARQKIPERYEFVDDLPRTAAGKVRKDRLRKRLWS